MIGKNPNKDYRKNIQFTGGSVGGYAPSSNPNYTAYKTADGRRGIQHQGMTYYDNGNGKFVSVTGRDYLTYDVPKKEEPAPPPSGGGGGGGGGGGSSSRSSGYGTVNPYAGSTGSPGLDASTLALMDMVKSLTESLTKSTDLKEAAKAVSKPPGDGLDSTVLTNNSYIPTERKKKKSYLTPVSVG